ncbi:hypothetical protein HYQ46_004566 [Verticillium longisporum]|nr:hypothetical protein HYQ46_004566 [Verticillium longisporum]
MQHHPAPSTQHPASTLQLLKVASWGWTPETCLRASCWSLGNARRSHHSVLPFRVSGFSASQEDAGRPWSFYAHLINQDTPLSRPRLLHWPGSSDQQPEASSQQLATSNQQPAASIESIHPPPRRTVRGRPVEIDPSTSTR